MPKVPENKTKDRTGNEPEKQNVSNTNQPVQPAGDDKRPVGLAFKVNAPDFNPSMPVSIDDDLEPGYKLGRQFAHELHSRPTQLWFKHVLRTPEQDQAQMEKDFAQKPKSKGTRKDIEASQQAAKEFEQQRQAGEFTGETDPDPYIDPVSAAAGGFVGAGSLAVRSGMNLMPSLGRAAAAGLISSLTEVPLGMVTEEVGEKFPAAALPFNVAAGMLTGATLEKAVEDAVVKYGGKAGRASKAIFKELMDGEPVSDLAKKVKGDFDAAMRPVANERGEVTIGGGKKSEKPDENSFSKAADELEGQSVRTDADIRQGDYVKAKGDKYGIVESLSEDKKSARVYFYDKKAGTRTQSVMKLSDLESAEGIGTGGAKVPNQYIDPDYQSDRITLAISDDTDFMDQLSIRHGKTGDVLLVDNINMDRIESPEDLEKVIGRTAKAFSGKIDEAKRGVIANKETERLAEMTGLDVKTLLNRRKGEAFNAEYALAARKILVASAENIAGIARKIRQGNASDNMKFAFRRAMSLHYAVQAQVSAMTAEAGRALQSFRIVAGAGEDQAKAIKEMLTSLPAGVNVEKMADKMGAYEFASQVSTFVAKANRAKTSDMLLEAWINGLLSGPQTHVVNSLSNALVAAWMPFERIGAATIAKVTRSDGPTYREAFYQAYGLIEGIKDGFKAFSKALRSGEPSDSFGKIEARQYKSITADNIRQLPLVKRLSPNALQEGGLAARVVDFLGDWFFRLPGRFLGAEDDFFKAVGYRMELRAQAFRRVHQEGYRGKEAAEEMHRILADPEMYAPEVNAAAISARSYQTFTKPLGSTGQAISGLLNRNPIMKLIVPFMRTPTNILKFAGERSPLAFASKAVLDEIAAGGARRDMALAKIGMGSMVMSTAAVLSAQGLVTGGGPKDSKKRATLRRMRWQPYSIKIGDKWIAYNRLEPLGMLFGVAADFAEIAGFAGEDMAPEVDKFASAVLFSFSKNVTSKTWLEGISKAIEALEDPDRYGKRFLQGYVKSVIPTFLAQSERTKDPTLEAVYSNMDAIKSRIPWLSETLPDRRNIWGEKITTAISKDRGWFEIAAASFNPLYVSKEKQSAIDKEFRRMDYHPSMPKMTQSFKRVPVEMDGKEFDYFIRAMNFRKLPSTGKTLKKTLDDLVSDRNYQSLDIESKQDRIDSFFRQAKRQAKELTLKKFPRINALVLETQKKIQQDLITGNYKR